MNARKWFPIGYDLFTGLILYLFSSVTCVVVLMLVMSVELSYRCAAFGCSFSFRF